jgi:hypothetical protein
MSAALKLPKYTTQLQKQFPNEWSAFKKQVETKVKNSLPKLPKENLDALRREKNSLQKGTKIRIAATKSRPFILEAVLYWDDDESCTADNLRVLPIPGASERERKLVACLREVYDNSDMLYDCFIDDVMECKEARELNKRIEAFWALGQQLETEYAFDFEDVLYGQ